MTAHYDRCAMHESAIMSGTSGISHSLLGRIHAKSVCQWVPFMFILKNVLGLKS